MVNIISTIKNNLFMAVMLSSALYALYISIPFLGNQDIEWEWLSFSAAQGIIRTGLPETSVNGELLLCQPPLMPYLMAFSMKLFGESVTVARIPGLIMFFISAFILFRISCICQLSRFARVSVVVIFLTSPFIFHGYLSMDYADGTFCPLFTCIYIHQFMSSKDKKGTVKDGIRLGLVLSLLFLAKMSNGVIMIFATSIVCLLDQDKNRYKLLSYTFLSFLIYAIAMWVTFCVYVHLKRNDLSLCGLVYSPFDYMLSSKSVVGVWDIPSPAQSLAMYLSVFAVYSGPLIIFGGLAGIAIWANGKLKRMVTRQEDIIPVFCIGVLIAYSLFLGGNGPFKKYFITCVPLLPVIFFKYANKASVNIDLKEIKYLISLVCVMILYYVILVGDPMHVLYVDAKILSYFGSSNLGYQIFIITMILYFIPFLILLILWKRFTISRKIIIAVIFIVSSQMSMTLTQSIGGYGPRWGYGLTNTEIVKMINKINFAGGCVLTPRTSLFAFFCKASTYEEDDSWFWGDTNKIYKHIKNFNPNCIVYGFSSNQVNQLIQIQKSVDLQNLLQSEYRLYKGDLLWLWVRKNSSK